MDVHDPFSHLLRLVSRGNAIIAELSRLSQRLPRSFVLASQMAAAANAVGLYAGNEASYESILYDFRYFKAAEYYEKRIESNDSLLELDDTFRDTYLPFLERCYRLFESIVRYHGDLQRWYDDLQAGIYIQYTIEGVAMELEGKQLLVEAVALFGSILLLLDRLMGDDVREMIVVSYYRYKGASELVSLDSVCSLCRRTGFSAHGVQSSANGVHGSNNSGSTASMSSSSYGSNGGLLGSGTRAVQGYPEDYFGRFSLPMKLVNLVISRLRSDDVYNQMVHFPAPEHRSAALSQQSSCLYVVLYFAPNVLHGEFSTMREIVDKHFVDAWVVYYGQGMWADLSVEWEGYKAAKAAIANVFAVPRLKEVNLMYITILREVSEDLKAYLQEGVLNKDLLLNSMSSILECLRKANIVLRWLTSHHSCLRVKKLQDVLQAMKPEKGMLLSVLLDTAQVEFRVKDLLSEILAGKEDAWEADRQGAVTCLEELAEFYEGSKVLSRTVKDLNLHRWFGHIAQETKSLEVGSPVPSGRKIQQIISALEEVEQFHQIDVSLQTKQYLADTREHLYKMIKTVNIRQEEENTLTTISDSAWLFSLVKSFIPGMHVKVRNDPFAVLKLQTLFLKMRSMMDLPLLRISQSESADLLSVSQHYSRELVGFVRRVLEVVPSSVFTILTEIAEFQKDRHLELPTKLEKDALRDVALLDDRFKLARATHRIAAFTHGILAMQMTFIGVIELDPRQLLEDGVRKELVQQISQTFYMILTTDLQGQRRQSSASTVGIFGRKLRLSDISQDLQSRLEALRSRLDGNKQSFEYIQDYINIPGLRVWMEELARVIGYNVENECNQFLRRKIDDWHSDFQSTDIPIPKYSRVDTDSVTFMGRLVHDLIRVTDPSQTMYLMPMSAWYTADGTEVMGIRQFSLLRRAMDVPGLWGVDRIFCFMIVHTLRNVVDLVTIETGEETKPANEVSSFAKAIKVVSECEESGASMPLAWYTATTSQLEKIFCRLIESVVKVGQYQLIRRQLASEIVSIGRLESSVFVDSLKILNNRLLAMVEDCTRTPIDDAHKYPEGKTLASISHFLESAGMHSPLLTIFTATEPNASLPLFLALFIISNLHRYVYDSHLSSLVLKAKSSGKNSYFDVMPLVVGILTILKQYHIQYTILMFKELARYVKAAIEQNCRGMSKLSSFGNAYYGGKNKVGSSCPVEVLNLFVIIENLCSIGGISREVRILF